MATPNGFKLIGGIKFPGHLDVELNDEGRQQALRDYSEETTALNFVKKHLQSH